MSAFRERMSCAVCGTALTALQSRAGLVCGKPICAWKFDAVPAHERCAVCGRALTVHQRAAQTCAQPSCRQVWLADRPLAMRRERRKRLESEGIALRARVAAELGIADAHSYRLTIVPQNYAPSRKLPTRRRRALRAHLEHVLQQAIAHQEAVDEGTEQPRPPLPALVPPSKEVGEVMLHACVGCRGSCCRTGDDHAYITPYTMLAYRCAHPNADIDEILDAYLSHVPKNTLQNGCVYQHATGCTLPRDMRGDTCNRFYCDGLREFEQSVVTGEPPRAFFIPMDDLSFTQVVFAAPDLVKIVRHQSTGMEATITPAQS